MHTGVLLFSTAAMYAPTVSLPSAGLRYNTVSYGMLQISIMQFSMVEDGII